VECGPADLTVAHRCAGRRRPAIVAPAIALAIVSIWEKLIKKAISIRLTPAFLPHQRPVSMSTACAALGFVVDL